MEEPALRFQNDPYDPETLNLIMLDFRSKGYALLPGVFVRSSVDAFLKQVHQAMFHDGLQLRIPDDSPLVIWPAQAPRIRQVLVPALSHSAANPLPSLYMDIWVIQPQDSPGVVPSWHKDREPDGMPGKEYHYPRDVFAGMYFEDMSEGCGPTRVLPGSHRDISLSPFAEVPGEPILCRKEDAYLLDQRTWHCGTPRKVPGIRTLAVYGYYPVPFHYNFPFRMPKAQRDAWLKASKRVDKAFFGGIFEPPDELKGSRR